MKKRNRNSKKEKEDTINHLNNEQDKSEEINENVEDSNVNETVIVSEANNSKDENSSDSTNSVNSNDEKKSEEKILYMKNQDGKIVLPQDYVWGADYLIGLKTEEIPCLINPIFPKTGLVAISGGSDVGKSSFLRQLAISIVTRENDFLGFKIQAEHHRVVYVSTEDDRLAISMLINKQNVNRLPESEFQKLGFIFDITDLIPKISNVLIRNKADCVIIDAFADVYGGDLNASNKVRNYLQRFSNLSDRFGCLFIFLHHTGKRTDFSTPSKHNLLGSQGFEAKMRLVIELRRDIEDPSIAYLFIVKGNYLPAEFKKKGYKLRFDENMRFTNLNERIVFSEIYNPMDDEVHKENFKKKAIYLKKNGKTLDDITTILKDEGCKYGRSTIGKWIKNDKTKTSCKDIIKTDFSIDDDMLENEVDIVN